MIRPTTILLSSNSPQELIDFVARCRNTAELIKKLQENPSKMASFIQHMSTEGNEHLTDKLISYSNCLSNPEVKKIKTALRNRGLLNRGKDADFSIKVEGETFKTHKAILALEVPYFSTLQGNPNNGYKELLSHEFLIKEMGISPIAYQKVLDYLYLSDPSRKKFLAEVDRSLLVDMAKLADFWGMEELKKLFDEELCNAISELSIDTEGLDEWLKEAPSKHTDKEIWLQNAPFPPKFTQLLAFLKRAAPETELESLLEKIETREGADEFAEKCTLEESALFSTLTTEFGKACQTPPGAFGKAKWEKTFPVTILKVPPLPPNIHAILDMEDPCEPGKKLKDTCVLFLRPEKVLLREENNDKIVELSFDGVKELAMKASHPNRRTSYNTFRHLYEQINRIPIAPAGWVLMRNEVILGTRNSNFDIQKEKLKGQFRVPKAMDAILLKILIYASEGKIVYENKPMMTYTRCLEVLDRCQIVVGEIDHSGLSVHISRVDSEYDGLSGSWEF